MLLEICRIQHFICICCFHHLDSFWSLRISGARQVPRPRSVRREASLPNLTTTGNFLFYLLISLLVSLTPTALSKEIPIQSPTLLLPRAVYIRSRTPQLHDLSGNIAPSILNTRPPTRRISKDRPSSFPTWHLVTGRT